MPIVENVCRQLMQKYSKEELAIMEFEIMSRSEYQQVNEQLVQHSSDIKEKDQLYLEMES